MNQDLWSPTRVPPVWVLEHCKPFLQIIKFLLTDGTKQTCLFEAQELNTWLASVSHVFVHRKCHLEQYNVSLWSGLQVKGQKIWTSFNWQ